jgi:hypothetical protein
MKCAILAVMAGAAMSVISLGPVVAQQTNPSPNASSGKCWDLTMNQVRDRAPATTGSGVPPSGNSSTGGEPTSSSTAPAGTTSDAPGVGRPPEAASIPNC